MITWSSRDWCATFKSYFIKQRFPLSSQKCNLFLIFSPNKTYLMVSAFDHCKVFEHWLLLHPVFLLHLYNRKNKCLCNAQNKIFKQNIYKTYFNRQVTNLKKCYSFQTFQALLISFSISPVIGNI